MSRWGQEIMAEFRETSGNVAASPATADRPVAFDDFRFDARTGELWHGQREVKLTPRAAAVLALLSEHAQHLVTKQRLFAAVWNRRAVTDDALTSSIQELRRALGDDGRRPRYIETRHGRGYRLMVPVTVLGGLHGEPVEPRLHGEPVEPRRPSGAAPAAAVGPAPTLPDMPSLAVLPFDLLSPDPEQGYFADGLVEDMTTALSRIRSFFVVARNSSFTFKGKAVPVQEVGRTLGVRYVVEGSVRRAGERLRLTAQLVEAENGRHVWADRFDADLADVFDLQDRIVEQIVGAISPSVRAAEIERARLKRPGSLQAYDYLLQAYPWYWSMDQLGLRTAIELLRKAVELDPNYAMPMALASWCHASLCMRFFEADAETHRREGLGLASRALLLSPDDPNVLACAGNAFMHLGTDADLDHAGHLLRKAVTLDPNSTVAWRRLGLLHVNRSEPDEAVAACERALRLSPLDPVRWSARQILALAHFVAGRLGQAVQQARLGLAEWPRDPSLRRMLAASLAHLGEASEAQHVVRGLLADHPDLTLRRLHAGLRLRPAARETYLEGLRLAGVPE
jgi:adenylate cyclase